MLIRVGSNVFVLPLFAQIFGCSSDGTPEACSAAPQVHAGSFEVTGRVGSGRLDDLECVEVITGDLLITHPGLRSVQALGSLVHVFGNVRIDGSPIQSLHGLERLQEIGGNLSLSGADFDSLDGLDGLRQLGGDLALRNLPKLASVRALSSFSGTSGSLYLEGLPSLGTLEGLDRLAVVGGNLTISDTGIADLDALRSLQRIGGAFLVTNNLALTSATFRQSVLDWPTVGGPIGIGRNPVLGTLTGFGFPVRLDSSCEIGAGLLHGITVGDNPELERIELPRVDTVSILVTHNPRLSTLSGMQPFGSGKACNVALSNLPGLTHLDLEGWKIGSFDVTNTGLTTLDGIENAAIQCTAVISENHSLSDVSALSSQSNIAAYLQISNNSSLPTCEVEALADDLPAARGQCFRAGRLVDEPRVISIDGNDDEADCD
jgi:hypothetical protein